MARQHGLEGLSARQSYNQARNQVRKRTRQLRKQYELNIANQSTSNPKVFWRFARDRLKGMPYEERLRKLNLPTMTYRRARGTPFSLNVSTLRVVSLSLSSIWHLHYGMISPWQLERQSVEIHLKIDWTSIGEGTL